MQVTAPVEKFNLPWDRYVRLDACAKVIKDKARPASKVLDAGGFDGALAFFLPDHEVYLLDPLTTGGDALSIQCPDRAYETVVAVDVLEHVAPVDRPKLIAELARASGTFCLLNFPVPSSMIAQKLVAKLTGNQFVQEHVDLQLPVSGLVENELTARGFSTITLPHTSSALWVAYFTLNECAPEKGQAVSKYLIEEYAQQAVADPLYNLIVAWRKPD